jgi:hypothetical protein
MEAERYNEDFEYEDVEANDEAFEGDESFEAAEADEGDEGAEADEADGEADEADEGDEGAEGMFEASDEGDEADETFGEADEADEAVLTASARLQMAQDRNRRRAYENKIRAGQRRDALRAAATQRTLTSQLRGIPPGGVAKVQSVAPLQGAGVVTAILPNGRQSRMRIVPTVASVREVNRLRVSLLSNERRQSQANVRNAKAIRSLAVAQASTLKRLTAQQVKSDKDLGMRIVEGHNRLDKRITKELGSGTGFSDKRSKRMLRQLERQRRRALMDGVLLATAAPFFSAYGDKSNPFGFNNLVLTGSTVGWMVGDELIDAFAGKSSMMRSLATVWSYAAPVGNGLTNYLALRNYQHERFISGVAKVKAGETTTVELEDYVGTASFSDFTSRDHFVAAAPRTHAVGITAVFSADKSQLLLTMQTEVAAITETEVVWVVDTHEFTKAVTSTD